MSLEHSQDRVKAVPMVVSLLKKLQELQVGAALPEIGVQNEIAGNSHFGW